VKVFGIGLARTGTTSLYLAFEQLGLRSAPSSVAMMRLFDEPDADLDLFDTHDAFTDNPVPFLFALLDRRFPGSKFVLTTRPIDAWLRSMEWLFGDGLDRLDKRTRALGDEVHERLYGITSFDATVLTDVYVRHHSTVAGHFERRSDDLLTVPVAELSWLTLCDFLDCDPPSSVFPHVNSSRNLPSPGTRRGSMRRGKWPRAD
jgi:hypothetical protein